VDDLVEKALARWPNVPAIAGWLKLSAQADWLLTGPVPEGLTISHSRILNFIARNYAADDQGRYYFQNGPQKVFVSLAYTPWVYRLYPLDNGHLMLATHTGLVVWPTALYMDEQGRVLIQTEEGVGLLHSADMDLLARDLTDKDGKTIHTCTWEVPDGDPQVLVAARVPLRKRVQISTGQRPCVLEVKAVDADKVPELFNFQQNPEVSL